MDCGLRTADCGLRTADCGLRTADCGLRTADCGLRTADCRLQTEGHRNLVVSFLFFTGSAYVSLEVSIFVFKDQ